MSTGPKQQLRRKRGQRTGYLPAAAVLCILLIALLALIQVVHEHPIGEDTSHCPLCVMQHSAAPVTATVAVVVMVRMETVTLVFKPRALTRYWHPKLFTRPPPAGC